MAKNNNNTSKNRTCGMCKNCTPCTEFKTLSLKGEYTMGICPYWTMSKCVVLSLDTCDHFDLKDELSERTSEYEEMIKQQEREKEEKKEAIKSMVNNFYKDNPEIKETLPYGKQKTTKRRKK